MRPTLRPATREDSDRLLAWRNDPDAVRTSMTGSPVSPGEHALWVDDRLRRPLPRLWIAEVDGIAVGQVRLDVDDQGAGVVSIAVAREHRGRGLAAAMLDALAGIAAGDPNVHRLIARVREDNAPSLRAFRRAGYDQEWQTTPGWLELSRAL